MQMNPLDSNEVLAKALTEKLLQDIGNRDRVYRSEKSEIFTADVEVHIDEFHYQLQFLNRIGPGIPCVRTSNTEAMPVSLRLLPMISYPWEPYELLLGPYPYLLDLIAEKLRQWGFIFEQLSDKEAVAGLRSNLTSFLKTRFSARQSDISQGPGLSFRVITQNHGLRIRYCPSFFLSITHVLGSPSSPVTGWVQPGTYKFGAEGPSLDFTLDPADFDIPPLTEAELVTV